MTIYRTNEDINIILHNFPFPKISNPTGQECQGHKREQWIAARKRELLPVPYFHVVFTLPSCLNRLAMHEPKAVYDSLFAAAWSTLNTFGHDPKHLGAQVGMISILHTWGQQLTLHPHLHCIVPGGGLTKSGRWKMAKSKGKFLFPVKTMSTVFRARYLDQLRKRSNVGQSLLNEMYSKNWVVYAKRPFAQPMDVVEYLGRYTHKVAISNHRFTGFDDQTITFTYKDYRQGGRKLDKQLNHSEFIRRFSMHILPRGFMRIRHYGILSSTSKNKSLTLIREQLSGELVTWNEPRDISESITPGICPYCKTATIITLEILPSRDPPNWSQSLSEIGNEYNN